MTSMNRTCGKAALWLLLVPLAGLSRSALDRATLEAFLRHLFVWASDVQVELSQPQPSELKGYLKVTVRATAQGAERQETVYVSEDGRQVVQATIYDVNQNPFAAMASKLNLDGSPRWGPKDAPVTIVIFSDFQCSYCRQEAQLLRERLPKELPGKVQLVFKDLPLESIHPWAREAAMAGRCVYRQSEEAFWKFHDWIFAHQLEIQPANLVPKVLEFAASSKDLDVLQLQRCIEGRQTQADIDRALTEARQLGLNSTPTLFINGRKITGAISWDTLRRVIEVELQYQESLKGAGCCAIELAGPGVAPQ